MSKARKQQFSDGIREAIRGSGKSINEIGRETGVAISSLSRFMNGKGWMGEAHLNNLVKYLKLTITKGR